jgi:hypothetical protein
VLFSASTAFYLIQRGSLLEFVLSLLTIIPLSTLARSATQDIVLKLEAREHELLAGIVNGIFGYPYNPTFTS